MTSKEDLDFSRQVFFNDKIRSTHRKIEKKKNSLHRNSETDFTRNRNLPFHIAGDFLRHCQGVISRRA